MKLPKIEINEKLLIQIAQNFRVKEMYFFGSVLGNDFNEKSDIDIMITFQNDVHYSCFELFELCEKFKAALNRPINLIEKESLKNPYRRNGILKTARRIYAA